MKKRTLSFLLISALTIAMISGCGNKNANNQELEGTQGSNGAIRGSVEETTEGEFEDIKTLEEDYLGFKFDLPSAWYQEVNGGQKLQIENYTDGLGFTMLSKSGKEKMAELQASMAENTDMMSYTDEQMEMIEEIYGTAVPICAFMVIKDGAEEDAEMLAQFTDRKELGKVNNTTYTLLYNSKPDISELDDEDKETFNALHSELSEIEENIELTGLNDTASEMNGEVSFETKKLDGTEACSADIFAENKLTLVNIWATWCGPCVNEIPELEELYKQLPEGVNLLGICTDGEDENELAQQILEQSKVTYTNISANEEMNKGFLSSIQSLPTTIFVDRNGNIVGEPMVGAPSEDVVETYQKAIDEHLKLIEE